MLYIENCDVNMDNSERMELSRVVFARNLKNIVNNCNCLETIFGFYFIPADMTVDGELYDGSFELYLRSVPENH